MAKRTPSSDYVYSRVEGDLRVFKWTFLILRSRVWFICSWQMIGQYFLNMVVSFNGIYMYIGVCVFEVFVTQ